MSHFEQDSIELAQILESYDSTFWPRIEGYQCADIDPSFMGFVSIYKGLADIIPKNRIVIDLGCAYASQAYYFREHRGYIGVDVSNCPKVESWNAKYFNMTIADFLESDYFKSFDQGDIFGICIYVPPSHGDNLELTRHNFNNCYTYYPSASDVERKTMVRDDIEY